MTTSVAVVGGGLAGLCAAIEAARDGAKVTLIEKNERIGGNSAKATSGINALAPKDAEQQVKDETLFSEDTVRSGHGLCDLHLVKVLIQESGKVLDFFKEAGMTLDSITQCGGHKAARTHRFPPKDGKPVPVGFTLVSSLEKYVREKFSDTVTILTKTRVTRLEHDQAGRILGVRVQTEGKPEEELGFDAVVLTTGGYGHDHTAESLLWQSRPDLKGLPTTNGPWADGDGLKLAMEAGAAVRDLIQVQVHPTGFVDPKDPDNQTKFLAPEALRGCGGILLNQKGNRFVDELDLRDAVTEAIFKYGDGEKTHEDDESKGTDSEHLPRPHGARPGTKAYLIMTEEGRDKFGPGFFFYHKIKGFFTEVTGIKGLSEALGCDMETARATMKAYQASAQGESPDKFGKSVFPDTFQGIGDETGTLFIAAITPSIHYTMGGVRISPDAEVLMPQLVDFEEKDVDSESKGSKLDPFPTDPSAPLSHTQYDAPDSSIARTASAKKRRRLDHVPRHQYQLKPFRGLFAAGEVTGGVHGGNRLAGNSLLECVVFGRIAGRRAADIGKTGHPVLSPVAWTPFRFREIHEVATDMYLVRFSLPSPLHSVFESGMEVGQYVSVKAKVNGEDIIRYYSVISRPEDHGCLDLLLKIDPKGGLVTTFMKQLRYGDTVDFKGPLGPMRLHFDNPNSDIIGVIKDRELKGIKKIGMICGGAGLAPMSQIIRSILYHGREDIEATLVLGAPQPKSLPYYKLLKQKNDFHPNVKVHFTVDWKPEGSDWDGRVGFIDKAMLEECLPPPGSDVLVVICGPPKMCEVMKSNLKALDYTDDMIFSYM